MTEYLETNLETLFKEIVERGRKQGAVSQEAYNDLVEAVIEEHRSVGEIHDDTSTEGMEEQFRGRWSDYTTELGLNTKLPQL